MNKQLARGELGNFQVGRIFIRLPADYELVIWAAHITHDMSF